jgi:hypothetical protein
MIQFSENFSFKSLSVSENFSFKYLFLCLENPIVLAHLTQLNLYTVAQIIFFLKGKEVSVSIRLS